MTTIEANYPRLLQKLLFVGRFVIKICRKSCLFAENQGRVRIYYEFSNIQVFVPLFQFTIDKRRLLCSTYPNVQFLIIFFTKNGIQIRKIKVTQLPPTTSHPQGEHQRPIFNRCSRESCKHLLDLSEYMPFLCRVHYDHRIERMMHHEKLACYQGSATITRKMTLPDWQRRCSLFFGSRKYWKVTYWKDLKRRCLAEGGLKKGYIQKRYRNSSGS